MKRLSSFILIVTFSAFAIGQVSAQNASPDKQAAQQTSVAKPDCGKFTDANQDGVCDNHAARVSEGKGMNYADSNKDGICDHHADGTACKGKGECCKQNCQHNPDCCKATGEQHRHGDSNQCPGQKAPDKK